jgi:hypothetical protein
MIGLAADHSSLFVRRNPDATTFTPKFEINSWNFNFRHLHHCLLFCFGRTRLLLKSFNGCRAVIGLVPAFGQGASQHELSSRHGLTFSFTAIQSK